MFKKEKVGYKNKIKGIIQKETTLQQYEKDEKKGKNIEILVVFLIPLWPLYTCGSVNLPTQEVLQYFRECLWTSCGQCGVSSSSDLALLCLYLLSKFTIVSKVHSFRLTAEICLLLQPRPRAISPSLLCSYNPGCTSLWVWPAAVCRSRSGSSSCPDMKGQKQQLIKAHLLSRAGEKER